MEKYFSQGEKVKCEVCDNEIHPGQEFYLSQIGTIIDKPECIKLFREEEVYNDIDDFHLRILV